MLFLMYIFYIMTSLEIFFLVLCIATFIVAMYSQLRVRLIRQREREKIEERRSSFISIISHQLRTPLSVIKGYLEGVLTGDQGALQPGQREYLQEALDINRDTIKLVNDYLEVVRMDADSITVHPEPINLVELVEAEIKKLTPLARASNCELIFEKPTKSIPMVRADHIKIRQVIENILTNAIKYSKGKGRALTTLSTRDGMVQYQTTDNGVGVPADQIEEVFTKFSRGKNVIHKDTTGSGIGLYVAKMIVNALGGEIWIESKENEGTSVFFTLPLDHQSS